MMEEKTMMSAERDKKNYKIRTTYAKIHIGGTKEKPCYSIVWYDMEKNEYNLGFSSYYLEFVQKWLEECFEIIQPEEKE